VSRRQQPSVRCRWSRSSSGSARPFITYNLDGIGEHQHGDFRPHDRGEPKFTDEEVVYLLNLGWHPDRHHGRVYGEHGSPLTPLVVSQILQRGRAEGKLQPAKPAQGGGKNR
jgi:hypothetical protein